MVRKVVTLLDRTTGVSPLLKKTLRYAFPDHWSFLLGEVALYAFMVLIGTGVYLTLFFEPSLSNTVYHGSYAPLEGHSMSVAYKSVLDISFERKAGLLFRQTHHWAANVFVAAIVLHLMRVFFTGAFRRPRSAIWTIGVVMLMVVLLEGYLGYSMVDDLLSGMGLAIGYGVALSLPLIGGNLALLIWGAPFPGAHAFESRMYIGHVFLFPLLIAGLLTVHLALVARFHHTQFRRSARQTEKKLVGLPMFPAQAPRSIGLLLGTAGLLFLLGGLVQINPIWQWGPFETYQGTNGAQPDWYLGWLIGALRLVPGFDLRIGDFTLVPNPFWGGVLYPLVVFGILLLMPALERRFSHDQTIHNVADRPRDAPGRTAFGMALLTWVACIFVAGSSDRMYVFLGLSYNGQIWFWRAASLILPVLAFFVTRRICRALLEGERIDAEREAAEEEALRRSVPLEPADRRPTAAGQDRA